MAAHDPISSFEPGTQRTAAQLFYRAPLGGGPVPEKKFEPGAKPPVKGRSAPIVAPSPEIAVELVRRALKVIRREERTRAERLPVGWEDNL